jgi:hypothetical protein
MSEPRKHHYVPQFYLAGFTRSGTKEGELFVLDLKRQRRWTSSPANVAHQRDYYKIDNETEADPNGIERALAKVEGECGAVIQRIIESRALPDEQDFDVFLNFVAMMAARVPHIRNALNDSAGEVARKQAWYLLNTAAGHQEYREMLRAAGKEVSDADIEATAKLLNEGAFTFNMDQTSNVNYMLRIAGGILPLLSERKWTLWFAADGAPDLICSDVPVVLAWTKANAGPLPPAFVTPGTTLSIALNRRIVAISSFEGQISFDAMPAEAVAKINTLSVQIATQLYSADAEFIWQDGEKGITTASTLLTR